MGSSHERDRPVPQSAARSGPSSHRAPALCRADDDLAISRSCAAVRTRKNWLCGRCSGSQWSWTLRSQQLCRCGPRLMRSMRDLKEKVAEFRYVVGIRLVLLRRHARHHRLSLPTVTPMAGSARCSPSAIWRTVKGDCELYIRRSQGLSPKGNFSSSIPMRSDSASNRGDLLQLASDRPQAGLARCGLPVSRAMIVPGSIVCASLAARPTCR